MLFPLNLVEVLSFPQGRKPLYNTVGCPFARSVLESAPYLPASRRITQSSPFYVSMSLGTLLGLD